VQVDDQVSALAAATEGRVRDAVDLARTLTAGTPQPGHGDTLHRWSVLAGLGAGDLSAAKIAEAHLDALAILAEAVVANDEPDCVWGVYAAEGPGVRLTAEPGSPDGTGAGWTLHGTKPWCSGAALLDRALVTAHTADGRRLFAMDLHHAGVSTEEGAWVSRGLAEVTSSSITLDGVPGRPVGAAGWYLSRPGFAWGGIGVAACWYGGAVGVARRMWAAAGQREPDQVALLLLGTIELELASARAVLDGAAADIDAGRADGGDGALLAERVRGVVAEAAEAVLSAAAHGLGPGPMATEEDHARRVADLQIFLRQHHAERDVARLGGLLLDGGQCPW
jgi:alkylation response protein AidB-like acyl-CoA dehydrogenase